MRSPRRPAAPVLAAALAAALALPAAARAEDARHGRAHPELAARLAAVRTVGLAEPELKIFELTASNQPVFRPDWTDQGRAAVEAGLRQALEIRGLALRPLAPASPERQEALRQARLLYGAVAAAVIQATYLNQFPAKVARFEYGLGDLSPLLDAEQVDAVLFVAGSGAVSSGGRQAIQALGALLAGVTSSGVDRLMVGLVDRQGDLLWFGTYASTTSDLRDERSAGTFVRTLTDDLPGGAR